MVYRSLFDTIIDEDPTFKVWFNRQSYRKALDAVLMVGDLINKKLKGVRDRLVRDVYLAPNQDVSGGDVRVSGEDVINAGRAIDKMGYRVLGWWHSHANFDTFHSGTDDENMVKVLNAIAPTNFVTTYRQMPLMSGELSVRRKGTNVEVYDVNNPNKKFRLNLGTKDFNARDLRVVKSIVADMPVRVGFAYSVVVNARGDKPYCEIATKDFCGLCYDGDERSIESRLRIINQNAFEIDEKQIVRDIKERIKEAIEVCLEADKEEVSYLLKRTTSNQKKITFKNLKNN